MHSTWNFEADSGIFLVNASTQERLRERNPKVKIRINEEYKDDGADIELPCASFDIFPSNKPDEDPLSYFPLKIARRGQESVLGRVFFQES